MFTCAQCTELFWDSLYGLLDTDQAQGLREHLAGCPACQAALAETQRQQCLVAQAARLYDMPAFVAPEGEEAAQPGPQSSPAAQPTRTAVLPQEVVRPRNRKRLLPWLAAAAVLLLAVGGYGGYHHALAQRQGDFDQALRAVKDVERQLAETAGEAKQQARELHHQVKAEPLHLRVLGPASYQSDAPNQYHVKTQNPAGAPAAAEVTARVVAVSREKPGRGQTLFEKKSKSLGELVVALPANLKVPQDSRVLLEVEARGSLSRVRVQDRLSLVPPACVTHLAVDKAIYRVGEILFFRSLTLDRFSHKPAGHEFLLVATLTDGSGARHVRNFGKTRPEGIGGGEFALTGDLAPGECTLEVAEAQGRFPAVTRRFVLVGRQTSGLDKVVTFDRAAYRPGDEVQANLQARGLRNGPAANQPVDVKVNVGGKRVAPLTEPLRTNGRGEANIQFRLPQSSPSGPASLELRVGAEGKGQTYVNSPIPMAGSHLEAEFFPEGGSLVAGLESRVYFRVRDSLGNPGDVRGVLVNERGQDQGVEVATKGQQGLGVFRFTPRRGHSYQVRVISPAGAKVRPRLPEVQRRGVVLSVPEGISREGKPLRAWVRKTGAREGVVVAASCQGRLVDQQTAMVGPDATRVQLNPPEGVNGVLRVTVYQPVGGQLVPLAERLVYRMPARRLHVALETDQKSYHPGEPVRLKAHSTTEKGKPEKSWLLAAAVNELALRTGDHPAETDLPAHFYLTSALRRPGDLDNMDIWVQDNPRSLAALDRFLGTQGWRRVVPAGRTVRDKDALVRNEEAVRRLAERGRPALFNLDNGAAVPGEYAAVLNSRLAQVRAETRRRAEDLDDQRQERIREARRAETALYEVQDWPRQVRPWVLFGLMLVLLLTGCFCLLIALVRVIRGSRATTPFFATACASLFLCMMTVLLARRLDPGARPGDGQTGLDFADAFQRNPDPADKESKNENLGWPQEETHMQLPAGLYAALPREKVVSPTRRTHKENVAEEFAREKQKEVGLNRKTPTNFRFGKGKDQENRTYGRANREIEKRFTEAKLRQQTQKSSAAKGKGKDKDPSTAPQPAPGYKEGSTDTGTLKKVDDKNKKDGIELAAADLNAVPTEYAHVPSGKEDEEHYHLPDTILWSPVLVAPGGSAQVSFGLPNVAATYRILVYGHSPDGRLGVAQEVLKVTHAKGNSPRVR
jgi:anti-sigma factor RsiW